MAKEHKCQQLSVHRLTGDCGFERLCMNMWRAVADCLAVQMKPRFIFISISWASSHYCPHDPLPSSLEPWKFPLLSVPWGPEEGKFLAEVRGGVSKGQKIQHSNFQLKNISMCVGVYMNIFFFHQNMLEMSEVDITLLKFWSVNQMNVYFGHVKTTCFVWRQFLRHTSPLSHPLMILLSVPLTCKVVLFASSSELFASEIQFSLWASRYPLSVCNSRISFDN